MTDRRHSGPDDSGLIARTLGASLAIAPDDSDHPDHDVLVRLVDDRLDSADREWLDAHIGGCRQCTEDVADLMQVQKSLQRSVAAFPARPSRRWLKPVAALATLAATIAILVRLADVPVAPAAEAPAPTPVVASSAEILASALTPSEQGAVDQALQSGRLELPPNTSVLRGRVGTLLGPTESAAPLAPLAPLGTTVFEPRPQFHWSALPDASTYVVEVFDEEFRQVASSGPLSRASWTPVQDLPRGRMLTWQVTATTPTGTILSPAPPQPEARFVVMGAGPASVVADQRMRLRGEPLALGILLARAGLFAEAAGEFERAASGPDAAQARALLADLRARLK